MLLLTVIASVFIGIQGAEFPHDERIMGGEPISIKEAPYQVALLSDYQMIGVYTHACSGSIINERAIVSAAQCTHETRSFQWKIRAGSAEHNDGGEVIEVIKFVQHPGFNSRLNNDIVLLFLRSNISFGDTSAAVRLPVQGQNVYVGFYAYISGWGNLDENGTAPSTLYKTSVIIISNGDCEKNYSSINLITDNMVCAERKLNGFCDGDKGGPFIVENTFMGIMSWGFGCAKPGFPGVYTKVSSHRNWIDTNIQSNLNM